MELPPSGEDSSLDKTDHSGEDNHCCCNEDKPH